MSGYPNAINSPEVLISHYTNDDMAAVSFTHVDLCIPFTINLLSMAM